MKKGFTTPVNELLQWVGLLLISLVMLYIITTWSSTGMHVQRGIEQASLMFTIANSANALSSMEEGTITRQLSGLYDIQISCRDGRCSVTTTPYDSSGKAGKESNSVPIIGSVSPVHLRMVNRITLTRERGNPVILTGERTESPQTFLEIPEFPPMCISTHPEISSLINDPDINQGEDPELIAAIIQAESSWKDKAYRYEPGFQIKYLEGTSWSDNPNWIRDGKTIGEWFDENPDRSEERDGFTDAQFALTAQTRISASYGLMQVMYPTALEICHGLELKGKRIDIKKPEDLYDPALNIFCGARYIKIKMAQYNDIRDAVSAYNAGKSVWTTHHENRMYVGRVLGYYDSFKKCEAA